MPGRKALAPRHHEADVAASGCGAGNQRRSTRRHWSSRRYSGSLLYSHRRSRRFRAATANAAACSACSGFRFLLRRADLLALMAAVAMFVAVFQAPDDVVLPIL